jgi:hypothetical protein
LAGDFAWKIKKPVNLGFLDFSTLEARRLACLEELRLNRRLTPELYLELVAIRGSTDAPTLEADGPIIEYAVKMRRFPPDSVVADSIGSRPPDVAEIADLAALVARFHLGLPTAGIAVPWGRIEIIRAPVEQSLAQLAPLLPAADGQRRLAAAGHFLREELARSAALIEARRRSGCVRECHGDLHLGNLVRIGSRLVPFDALEFDPALRWIDVLSEVAFLVMDFDDHGRRDLGFEFLNRYLDVTGDHEGLPVLPFYLGYRALVRAKVRALSPGEPTGESRVVVDRLLDYAAAPLSGARPVLILMCGVSGSGKSHLAKQIARMLPAIHLRSDIERKRLVGLDALARTQAGMDDGIYHPAVSRRTYARLGALASATLRAGVAVIVDATNLRRAHRAEFIDQARATGCPASIIACDAAAGELEQRVQRRLVAGADPSEAGVEVVRRQRHEFEPPQATEADLVLACDSVTPITPQEIAGRLRTLGRA